MRRLLIGLLLVSVGIGIGQLLGSANGQRALAQSDKNKNKFQEVEIGQVPTEFGAFKGMTGQTNNLSLAFETDKGELRILEFRGNKLNPRLFLVKREY